MSAVPAVPIETLESVSSAPAKPSVRLLTVSTKTRDLIWAAIVIVLGIVACFAVMAWMCCVA
jgi:hypothetical protein